MTTLNYNELFNTACTKALPVYVLPASRNAGWSSPVARQAHNLKAAGSNPAPATNPAADCQPLEETEQNSDTVSTQETAEFDSEPEKPVKFPKRIAVRGRVFAIVYGKTKAYPLYRVAWNIHGKRQMKAFDRFGGKDGAKAFAEKTAKDLSKGSQAPALSSVQAADALAAIERLQGLYQSTGKRLSLLSAVSEFADASSKLNGHTLREAVEGFLRSTVSVKRKDLGAAIDEFITAEEPRTRAKDGQRAQLSPKYHYNRAVILRRFAATFPNIAVCDLSKTHLDAFFHAKPVSEFSAKSKNHNRAAIRQFLQWTVRKDYLSQSNRLGEADSMRVEFANNAEIEFYLPGELRALVENAEGEMVALVALGGLAGLRTSELLQLCWEDVWRVNGHVEISSGKAKTRQRRLVEMNSALLAWLEPFRDRKGKIWIGDAELSAKRNENQFHKRFNALCKKAGVRRRQNGLRHAFVSFHYALHTNEGLTAGQAGNSPSMVHGHYKGLATKAEAEKWFATAPAKTDNIVPFQAVNS